MERSVRITCTLVCTDMPWSQVLVHRWVEGPSHRANSVYHHLTESVRQVVHSQVVIRSDHSPKINMPRNKSIELKLWKKRHENLTGTCTVCGDKASTNKHYGSKVCFSCRAFFRRLARKGKVPNQHECNRIAVEMGQCPINLKTRQLCRWVLLFSNSDLFNVTRFFHQFIVIG